MAYFDGIIKKGRYRIITYSTKRGRYGINGRYWSVPYGIKLFIQIHHLRVYQAPLYQATLPARALIRPLFFSKVFRLSRPRTEGLSGHFCHKSVPTNGLKRLFLRYVRNLHLLRNSTLVRSSASLFCTFSSYSAYALRVYQAGFGRRKWPDKPQGGEYHFTIGNRLFFYLLRPPLNLIYFSSLPYCG